MSTLFIAIYGLLQLLSVFFVFLVAPCLAISPSDVTATVLSEEAGPPTALFGAAYKFQASQQELAPGAHPRIAFSASEWLEIVGHYAAKRTEVGTWAHHFLRYTWDKGPGNAQLLKWSTLDTSAYTGRYGMNRTALKVLAEEITHMSEFHEGGFFMFALHAAVDRATIAAGSPGYLAEGKNTDTAIKIIVNFAKIALSHYATYGCKGCEYREGARWSELWDPSVQWRVHNDWYTGGLGMALSYDVLYAHMSRHQRRVVRSALAIMVKDRWYWGINDVNTRSAPNVITHPHRIFGNWAIYHANLYLTNLAIEGETDFDPYTLSVGVGFNSNINTKTIAIFDAFMKHSIYPDGTTFEDGYIYNLGLREGSLGFLALARRGHNHIDTPRFRNFILSGAAMHEPYRCGDLVGHSGGGGLVYPTFYALARYSYPDGPVPAMLWRQRMGGEFKENSPCRITFHQTMMQMAILGGEHTSSAESPAGLTGIAAQAFPLSMYGPRRGLLVARTGLGEDALYAHLDARPDAFFPGHDNADRGEITLSALRRQWLAALEWRAHPQSHQHSLVHIDGQAQAVKAPSVRMQTVKDFGHTVLAAADLTYAYNVQWARPWAFTAVPAIHERVWTDGIPKMTRVLMSEKEMGHPTSFGWPEGDDGRDLGFKANTSLWGEPDIGFAGLWNWKRAYRQTNLSHGVRSMVLVRDASRVGYALLGDDFVMDGSGKHTFESYFIFAKGITVIHDQSGCWGNMCKVSLSGGSEKQLDLHASMLGFDVAFRTETVGDSNLRLVISSKGRNSEQFCIAFHPHIGTHEGFSIRREGRVCSITAGDKLRKFRFNELSHALELRGESASTSCKTVCQNKCSAI